VSQRSKGARAHPSDGDSKNYWGGKRTGVKAKNKKKTLWGTKPKKKSGGTDGKKDSKKKKNNNYRKGTQGGATRSRYVRQIWGGSEGEIRKNAGYDREA